MTAAEKQTQSEQTRGISVHTAAKCDKQLELTNKQTGKVYRDILYNEGYRVF